jgi:hypothetical protein
MHRDNEMQCDDETERNNELKQGQEDAPGEAAGNATARNNPLLHYNQPNKAGAARGKDAAKQRYDTQRDNTQRDNETSRDDAAQRGETPGR